MHPETEILRKSVKENIVIEIVEFLTKVMNDSALFTIKRNKKEYATRISYYMNLTPTMQKGYNLYSNLLYEFKLFWAMNLF